MPEPEHAKVRYKIIGAAKAVKRFLKDHQELTPEGLRLRQGPLNGFDIFLSDITGLSISHHRGKLLSAIDTVLIEFNHPSYEEAEVWCEVMNAAYAEDVNLLCQDEIKRIPQSVTHA